MAELPSGTVTFLFTDIERSTQTLGEVGDEPYAELQDVHRELLRKAFAAHNGVEVGMEGDSFFVAFARAGDAVAAAIAGQRALDQGSRLRVRMGIHTGEALVRDDGYVGHDVHKAKRVEDAGHGGQILLSQTTADLVRSNVQLKDLGPHRLKDLGEPQRIFQVVSDDLPIDFPPLRSLAAFVHNLPMQRTAFIGREREIADIHNLFADHRLITLTGVGGCGKTRLAIEVGAERLDRHDDGVFFVDLAPVSDAGPVSSTLAATVGATSGSELIDFLANRRCLVIIDNCEHLLDEVADAVDRILAGCPHVALLATSREVLGVEGEQIWQVPSLSLADEAVELFTVRARAARRDFELSPANREAVAEICQRLDGIPLAIELAAARVQHLPLREIAARLDDMFRLLAGGRRRVQRHETLEAALDWSHQLLREPEQILLRRLAVFSGSFTIDFAERVGAMNEIGSEDVLDLIGSLVSKSLVVPAHAEGAARYRLLEPVRIYASHKLRDAGEADAFRARHRDSYLEWLEEFSWEQIYLSDAVGLELEDEHANLRAALEWSEAEKRPDLTARMGARLWVLWADGGDLEECGRYLGTLAPDRLQVDPEVRVAAMNLISCIVPAGPRSEPDTSQVSGWTRHDLLDRAIAEGADQASDPMCWALYRRAMDYAVRSRWGTEGVLAAAAHSDLERMEQMVEEIEGADAWQGYLSLAKGVVAMLLGDFQAAAEALWAAEPGDIYPGWFLDVAAATHAAGQHDRARISADRWLEASRAWVQRSRFFRGWHSTPAIALAGAGDLRRARGLLNQALDDYARVANRSGFPELLLGWVAIAHLSGNHADAVRLLAWIRSRTLDRGEAVGSAMAIAFYRHYADRLDDAFDPEQMSRLKADGSAMSEADVIALVRSI